MSFKGEYLNNQRKRNQSAGGALSRKSGWKIVCCETRIIISKEAWEFFLLKLFYIDIEL